MQDFSRALVNFLNTFEKEGNDTLGNLYFLYIQTLFESYKVLLQFEKKLISVEEKKK